MRFKLTAPEPAERDLHEAVASALDALLLPPAVWVSLGIGALKLTPAQMARQVRIGAAKPGWPDLLVLHQGIWGIELKTRIGRLSKTRIVRTKTGALREVVGQKDMFPRLLDAGVRAIAIVHSVDEALGWLRDWGIPLRGFR